MITGTGNGEIWVWDVATRTSLLKLKGAYFYSDYEDMQYASVGAIGFNERLEFLRDEFAPPVHGASKGWLATAGFAVMAGRAAAHPAAAPPMSTLLTGRGPRT